MVNLIRILAHGAAIFLAVSVAIAQQGQRCYCTCTFGNDPNTGQPQFTTIPEACVNSPASCACPSGGCVGSVQNDDACRVYPNPTLKDCSPQSAPPLPNATYIFSSPLTGDCLDLRSQGAGSPGGGIQHSFCNGSQWQRWSVTRGADGCYTFAIAGNRCMDVRDQTANQWGGTVQWNNCNDSSNQRFQLIPQGGFLKFVSKRNGLCIDLRDQERDPGGRIQTMVCNTSTNQLWKKN